MATRDLQVFTNDAFGTIRTVEHEDKVYFCGRDVVTALGYTNTSKAIQDHCRGVTFRYPIVDALGRTQEARFITEGDLYRLIFSSKLPAAQDFEAWVVDEILPIIRRHGVYAVDELLDNDGSSSMPSSSFAPSGPNGWRQSRSCLRPPRRSPTTTWCSSRTRC